MSWALQAKPGDPDPYKHLNESHKTYLETKLLPALPSYEEQEIDGWSQAPWRHGVAPRPAHIGAGLVDAMPFFHGALSRTAAERLLMSQGRIIGTLRTKRCGPTGRHARM